MDNIRSRSRYACLSLGFIALGLCAYPVHGQICISPTNAIVAENCLPGNPSSEWNITGVGSNSIQGFATDISVNRGSTIQFKIRSTTATAYRLDIYRSGYYGGAVGWMNSAGDGTFAVTIRCAELSTDRRTARLFAGGGIVGESDPYSELAETQAKFQAMMSAIIRP